MKISLIGYGKMGKTIEKLAIERGHTIVRIFDVDNKGDLNETTLKEADVVIEFTQPDQAAGNLRKCFSAGVPVVCGTTGWLKEYSAVKADCEKKNGTLFYASNYSIGVNLFFEINKRLAGLMNNHPQYDHVLIHESHHIEKVDSPSGTAITLAEEIMRMTTRWNSWVNYTAEESVDSGKDKKGEIPIFSTREDQVPGTHIVKYFSDVDEIEIIHKALNRQGFALGALAAAEWVSDKKGVFGMRDLLKL
ncbi:MAG: 4-hydroxy-tetrahydrodipicolinate reductase [Bacteroidia bacterium]